MSSAIHKLSKNFASFFKRINPSPTYEKAAARAHKNITALIENDEGPAGDLRINCFLQGSYKRDTAIHTINDVDIVALCSLSYKESANQNTRDQIFKMIYEAINSDKKYKEKTFYRKRSICIKIKLEKVKIEILPALRRQGKPYGYEPFYLFRPNEDESTNGQWEFGYARLHQKLISEKNANTNGLFVPMIKVLKHLRFIDHEISEKNAFSFHIECLLYAIKNSVYQGSTCECIEKVLKSISGFNPEKAKKSKLKTPCRDKFLFNQEEWHIEQYLRFHSAANNWHKIVLKANKESDKKIAVSLWKELLGEKYFPEDPT